MAALVARSPRASQCTLALWHPYQQLANRNRVMNEAITLEVFTDYV